MAHYEGSYSGQNVAGSSTVTEISGWVTGMIFFAASLMIIVGVFHMIEGIAAVVDDEFYVLTANYALEMDTTTWGWIHMIGGVVLIIAGFALLTGNIIARMVAIILAVGSAVFNFYSIPYYPVWSILMLAM